MNDTTRQQTYDKYAYQHDSYKVLHVRKMDRNCDLLLLTPGKDDTNKTIIPVDKIIMTANFEYFECMFREGSNWDEKNKIERRIVKEENPKTEELDELDKMSSLSICDDSKFIEIDIPHENVDDNLLAEYLKSAYDDNLKINYLNCISYYFIGNFLQDNTLRIEMIENFIKENTRDIFIDDLCKPGLHVLCS